MFKNTQIEQEKQAKSQAAEQGLYEFLKPLLKLIDVWCVHFWVW